MEESNKTLNEPQPTHEFKAYYDLSCDTSEMEKWTRGEDKRTEESSQEYEELLQMNHYSGAKDDYDGWLEAYCYIKEVEQNRERVYEKAKLNQTLIQCREALKGGEEIKISVGGISLGRIGREWLLDQIDGYFFRSNKWIIPYYFMYDNADYDNRGEAEFKEFDNEEEYVLDFLASQIKWLRDYEEMRGDRRGLYAKHLGRYVLYAMERVPSWAVSLKENEKYRFIGDMLEMAGVVDRYKGPQWTKDTWMRMDKKRRADQVRQWMNQASREEPK